MQGIKDDLLHAVRPQVKKYYGVPDGHVHASMRLLVNVGYKRCYYSNCALQIEKWVRDLAPFVAQDAENKWQNSEANGDPLGVLFNRFEQIFIVVVHTGLQSVWLVVSTLFALSVPLALFRQNSKQSDESEARVSKAGSCL